MDQAEELVVVRDRRVGRSAYIKAKKTELIAKKYIESIGYTNTVQCTAQGPDVVGFMNGRKYLFEVKPARKYFKQWLTSPVLPLRKNDDFIAIVFPNGFVSIQLMVDHLKVCSPAGHRNVASLFKELVLNVEPA